MRFTTRLLHGSFGPDKATGATTQPIYQTSAFYQETAEDMAQVFAGRKPGFVYTRVSNPTLMSLERRINELEGGAGAVACASGMAAVSQAVLNVLQEGDELVASGGLYGGTSSFFHDLAHYGIRARYAAGDSPEAFEAAITERTRLLYVETIGNPKLDVPDIAALAGVAHAHGIPLFVDNTVTTPYLCQPLALGADVVIHSTSKALNGNGNSIGGLVVSGRQFNWTPDCFPKFKEYRFGPMSFLVRLRMRMVTDYGGCMAPMNAYLTGIGLDTLALRLDRITSTALTLTEDLEERGIQVNYPGLASSPYHELAKRQFGDRFGAMLTICLGSKERAFSFINHLHYALNVSNIGDARTLVIHPATTIFLHASAQEKAAAGVTDDLVRINVGLEDPEDLLEDFHQALEHLPRV
ncbi:O-acetylhomoserine aminocarboxypropyltransferase/cysteine synthase family protein [Mitsuokella jalaludinii]|uniref:O-acetylhomoserine aminocarboxypropyltransferase/cysteine synthase family protein n=1 Tax=Mitsuokella jalaludinii TaxID=187979 RepID=UPI00265D433A|nr:PLP-dependent transferase [uncultured Mitsuokella sp.]